MERKIEYDLTDSKLAEMVQQGDRKAAAVLAERYRPLVISLCRAAFVRTMAEDLEQDLWVRFMAATAAYDPGKGIPFPGYIASVLRYERWNRFKTERRKWSQEADLSDQIQGKEEICFQGNLSKEDLREEAVRLPLTGRQRDILLLLIDGKRTTREMGEELSISQQAASYALQGLRKKLKEYKEKGEIF